jgi:L-serine kinase (ADP)
VSQPPEFRLVAAKSLRPHEQIEEADAEHLATHIWELGIVQEPIWVSREEGVILNGHHRYAALRKLGVPTVPAWIVDYHDPAMELSRWGPGPLPTKDEVIARGRTGELYPPKTTRHIWRGPAPTPHPTTLAELQADAPDNGSRPVPREPARPDRSR